MTNDRNLVANSSQSTSNLSVSIAPINESTIREYSLPFATIRTIRDYSLFGFSRHPFVGSLVENCSSSFKCNTGFGNRNWIVRIACLCQRKVSGSVLNKEADWRILIFQWRKGYFDLVGVWRCEDITWHRANVNLRWDSNSKKWIKSRSTLRCLRSSLQPPVWWLPPFAAITVRIPRRSLNWYVYRLALPV